MRVQEHIVIALRDLVHMWILFGSVVFVFVFVGDT